ncbi:unnamed protein product [Amoebophrya sp. A120]|nr:unnamed protein product [Amoebophrya sp. A120]|eukprot:GSA120T00018214001.1
MLLHSYGDEIDAHDFVLRMNRAPTRGFEKHVGKRESIRAGWDSTQFLRAFCTERGAALEATGTSSSGVADESVIEGAKNSSSAGGASASSRETVYVPEEFIPSPECMQVTQNENNEQDVQTELKTAAAAPPDLSEHTVASVAEQEKRRGSISSTRPPLVVPFMKTWQNVGIIDDTSITRFLQEQYGASEALASLQGGGGETSGAYYGVILLYGCVRVEIDKVEITCNARNRTTTIHHSLVARSKTSGQVRRTNPGAGGP